MFERLTYLLIFLFSLIIKFNMLLYMIFLAKSDDIFVLLVMVFMIILFTGVSIAFYILSELIKQATEYKNENDMTI